MHKKSALSCFHTFAAEGTKTSFCRCSSSATFQELSRKKKENFRPQHQTLHQGKPTTSSVASIEQRRLGFFLFFGKKGLLYYILSSLLPRPPSRRKLNLHHPLLRFSHNISLSRLKNEALLSRPLSTGGGKRRENNAQRLSGASFGAISSFQLSSPSFSFPMADLVNFRFPCSAAPDRFIGLQQPQKMRDLRTPVTLLFLGGMSLEMSLPLFSLPTFFFVPAISPR